MPQLDIVTFFSQFFWLCFFFIGFYYISYKYFLPQYSRCLLFREKFTQSSITGSGVSTEEKNNIEESLSMYITSAVGLSRSFLEKIKKQGSQWHKLSEKEIHETSWKAPISLYVKTFGAKQASENLCEKSVTHLTGMSLQISCLSKGVFSGENTPYVLKNNDKGLYTNKKNVKSIQAVIAGGSQQKPKAPLGTSKKSKKSSYGSVKTKTSHGNSTPQKKPVKI